MKKFFRLWLILLPFFFIHSTLATPSTQAFNTVVLPVSDQSNTEFRKALSKGFTEILIRLTGNTNVATLPIIKGTIKHAQQYVQYYRYLSNTSNDTSSTTPSLQLQINFNMKAIRRLLTQANIPIWSQNNRPTALVWIKTIQNNHVEFLSNAIDDQIASTVHSLSAQYGLPVLLPAMDLQDIQSSAQSAEQNTQQQSQSISNLDMLQKLMHRYGVDLLLFGNINENTMSHRFKSQWQLLFMHEMYQWSTDGKAPTNLINKAFKNTINILANHTLNESGSVQKKIIFLQIFNVNSLETYIKLSKYIAKFSKIKQMSLENLSQHSVTFKLTLTCNFSNGLSQYLNKNHKLYFIKQDSTSLKANQQDVKNIIPTIYYNYGQTITTQH